MNATSTLYQRLGGADGIPHLVEDVVAAHLVNPYVKTRFEKVEDMVHTKQLIGEFFTHGSGTPPTYTGKGMLGVHKDADVTEQEFLAAMDDIVGVMTKNGIDEDTKNEVLAIL